MSPPLGPKPSLGYINSRLDRAAEKRTDAEAASAVEQAEEHRLARAQCARLVEREQRIVQR